MREEVVMEEDVREGISNSRLGRWFTVVSPCHTVMLSQS